MSDSLPLARRLSALDDDALARLVTERRVPARDIRDFFDLADAIITVRRLIRCAWTSHRWDARPAKRP